MGPTFYALVEKAAQDYGSREFLYDGMSRLSFAELHDRAFRLAQVFRCHGLGEGDVFLTFIPNWVEYVISYAAASACGAVFATASFGMKGNTFNHVVSLVNPKMVLIGTSQQIDALRDMDYTGEVYGARCSDPRVMPLTSLLNEGGGAVGNGLLLGQASLCETPHCGVSVAAELAETIADGSFPVLGQDVSTVLFTSGSTGTPKGVLCTAFALEYVARQVAKSLHLTENDVYYMPLSWCHVFGLSNGLYGPLINGRRIVTGERYYPERALDLIEFERCTIQLGVPTMFLRELKTARRDGRPISLRCGISGGSGRSVDLVKDFEEYCGCRILPSYGMTEMTGGITATDLDAPAFARYDSEGQPLDGVEFLITDCLTENFGALDPDPARRFDVPHALPAGSRGQICLKSVGAMGGYYWGGPFASNPDLAGQWFPTGDVGYLDEDGYVYVTGRIRDIIIRGGMNIDPLEVESEYVQLPQVAEACLVGYPDAELGERTCLFLALSAEGGESAGLSAADLRVYAYSRVEKHKVPDKVVILDELPKIVASSKVDKKALISQAAAFAEVRS